MRIAPTLPARLPPTPSPKVEAGLISTTDDGLGPSVISSELPSPPKVATADPFAELNPADRAEALRQMGDRNLADVQKLLVERCPDLDPKASDWKVKVHRWDDMARTQIRGTQRLAGGELQVCWTAPGGAWSERSEFDYQLDSSASLPPGLTQRLGQGITPAELLEKQAAQFDIVGQPLGRLDIELSDSYSRISSSYTGDARLVLHFDESAQKLLRTEVTQHIGDLDKLKDASLPLPMREVLTRCQVTPEPFIQAGLVGTGLSAHSVRLIYKQLEDQSRLIFATELRDSSGEHVGNFDRSLCIPKDSSEKPFAYTDFIKLKEDQQGKGTARTLMANSFAQCRELGIDEMKLTAAITVGGYAWARYGFELDLSKSPDQKLQRFREQIEKRCDLLKLDEPTRDLVRILIQSEDPRMVWALADLAQPTEWKGQQVSLGKALLLGNSWSGTLKLEDPQTRQRLRSYLKDDRL